MIEGSKGLVSEILSSKGSNVLSLFSSTKPETIYNGFPIKFFEPKSYLEVVAEWFTSFPRFLSKSLLKSNKDPAYRMQQVLKAVYSTIYMTVKPAKSFNPVLGETFEGYITDNWKEQSRKAKNNSIGDVE